MTDDKSSFNPDSHADDRRTPLGGMFRNWYIEYASYVILDRSVPHISDGLKPVQRRILHAMHLTDDGRFNKVANVVGNTMQFHPHGDASIGDALVKLGQKELLVETQGNWGNILTGDSAAAPRYIEARLSEFALETVFSPKVTEWTKSYDGRKNEPVHLPVKFPLLLSQGVEGIAVTLTSKILPHNFNEICDAACACLRGEPFELYPDFQTAGLIDVSRYNDGARGGVVKVRAKIEKIDSKTLAITEIPFSTTTSKLIASILKAMEKGKIKIRKVDDNTAQTAEIIIHLHPGTSSDKTIDALYAFTDCETSISSNCCVILDDKPAFLSVSEILRHNVYSTRDILRRELEIRLSEVRETALFASLEKIFIENRMYKDSELEQAPDMDTAIDRVDRLLDPYKASFFRVLTRDDIRHLWEIRMGRILKFNSQKADEKIAALNAEVDSIERNLADMDGYTFNWFVHLKDKYGHNYPRRTVIRSFDSIEATKVAEANKRLFFDKEGGFIGTGLKDGEFQFTCSDIDDVLVIFRDGTYMIVKVQEKYFLGKGKKVAAISLYKKKDNRCIYNVIYRNGALRAKGSSPNDANGNGFYYYKRCAISGLTREKEYNLTKGAPGSRIEWLTCNPNGEAETVRVVLRDEPGPDGRRPRNREVMVDFSQLKPRSKESLGNLVTKFPIERLSLERKGTSTLEGRKVWFDADILRLNYDGRGQLLGSFQGDDQVLVITRDGEYFTGSYSDQNHYDDNILRIEKFDPAKVWTLALYDPSLGYHYLKRFVLEPSARPQRFAGSDSDARMLLLTDTPYPLLRVSFGGHDAVRPTLTIDAEEFIAVKGFKAKGKRISTFDVASVEELPPVRFPEPEAESSAMETEEEEETNDESENSGPRIVQSELFGDEAGMEDSAASEAGDSDTTQDE